jgi:predicted TPR repeat methyltransferase
MGRSSKKGKPISFDWVNENKDNINSILDIGAGSGTYIKLLSKIKSFDWTAVEAWEPYIDQFNLKKQYHTVFNVDIKNFPWNKKYDLVIAGDILEHLSKEDAVKIVNLALDHSKFMLISIPIVHYPQGEINNNPYEIHIKDDWSHKEVLETFDNFIKKSSTDEEIGVYWLSQQRLKK